MKIKERQTRPCKNAPEKFNNEKGKVNKKLGNNIQVTMWASGNYARKHQKNRSYKGYVSTKSLAQI